MTITLVDAATKDNYGSLSPKNSFNGHCNGIYKYFFTIVPCSWSTFDSQQK